MRRKVAKVAPSSSPGPVSKTGRDRPTRAGSPLDYGQSRIQAEARPATRAPRIEHKTENRGVTLTSYQPHMETVQARVFDYFDPNLDF